MLKDLVFAGCAFVVSVVPSLVKQTGGEVESSIVGTLSASKSVGVSSASQSITPGTEFVSNSISPGMSLKEITEIEARLMSEQPFRLLIPDDVLADFLARKEAEEKEQIAQRNVMLTVVPTVDSQLWI